jgi:LPS sulfotransferase NodH
MTNAGIFGIPHEYLNPNVVASGHWHQKFEHDGELSVGAYVEWLKKSFRTSNGVFGAKLLYEDIEHFGHFPTVRNLLRESVVIHLTRRSKLKQAISYYFAEKTGQWVSSDPEKFPADQVTFDFEAIKGHLWRSVSQDIRWLEYFEAEGLKYVQVVHEDVSRNPTSFMEALCDNLGIPIVDFEVKTNINEQRKSSSTQFRDQYNKIVLDVQYGDKDAVEYNGLKLVP